jgi:hypothetical protein
MLQLTQMIGLAFTALVSLGAIWKGGPPERLAGVAMLAATLISTQLADQRWIEPQWALMAIDVFMLALLVALALFADRWWPLWAAALQLLAFVIHLAFAAQERVISLAYMIALNVIGYTVIIALGAGTVAHMERRRRLRDLGLGGG